MANEYDDKVLALRKSTPQAVANYRVTASHMKDPATGDPYAIIESEYDYGVPGGARGTRKIQIGDELPEGSVTNITTEGITVIPPEEGDEFVLPIGHGTTPKPGKKTHTTPPLYDASFSRIREILDQLRMRETWEKEREDSGGEDPEVPPEVLSDEALAREAILLGTVGSNAALFTPDLLAAEAESYEAEDEPPSYLGRRERIGKTLEESDAPGTFDERFPFESFEPFDSFARFGGYIDKSEDGL